MPSRHPLTGGLIFGRGQYHPRAQPLRLSVVVNVQCTDIVESTEMREGKGYIVWGCIGARKCADLIRENRNREKRG